MIDRALWTLGHPGSWSSEVVLVSAAACAALVAGRRVSPLLPAALVVVLGATAYVALGGAAHIAGPVVVADA